MKCLEEPDPDAAGAVHSPALPTVRRTALDRDRLRRVTRLLRIVGLLQTGKRLSLKALAEDCGCCAKTIQRDLSYWSEMDVHIDYDQDRRSYVLSGALPFKILEFGLVEATSLALAQASVASAKGLNLHESLTSAFAKIEGLVPSDVAEILAGCRQVLLSDGDAMRDYSKAPLVQLVSACWRQLRVNVDYTSMSSGRRVRPIEPYRIAYLNGFWIVVANDPERREVRNFALDRIHSCTFPNPDVHFQVPADWSITQYMIGSVGVLRGERADIVLRFEPEAARWLQNRKWRFPHTLSEPEADGSITLCGTVAGLDEITREVLRWGRSITVIEPAALRERVAAEARAIAEKYR